MHRSIFSGRCKTHMRRRDVQRAVQVYITDTAVPLTLLEIICTVRTRIKRGNHSSCPCRVIIISAISASPHAHTHPVPHPPHLKYPYLQRRQQLPVQAATARGRRGSGWPRCARQRRRGQGGAPGRGTRHTRQPRSWTPDWTAA